MATFKLSSYAAMTTLDSFFSPLPFGEILLVVPQSLNSKLVDGKIISNKYFDRYEHMWKNLFADYFLDFTGRKHKMLFNKAWKSMSV